MTLFGKILIILNLLAAGGFVYLATKDWQGRQTITAAAVRHKLLLVGLPVEGPDAFKPDDETEFHIPMAGGISTDTVSKKIVELYFQAAPGGELGDKTPLPCQLAEVKRVRGKLESLLKDKSPGERVELLKEWLIDQSENFDQRLEVQSLAAAGNADELEKRLWAMFQAVQDAPAPAPAESTTKLDEAADAKAAQEKVTKVGESRAKPLDQVERQTRIANLLAALSQDPAWQKRVMIVVGLRTYVGTIEAQAARFRDMGARLERLIVTDQMGFQGQEASLNQLARDRTELANRESKLKAEKVEQKRKEDDFIGQRQTQLANIQKQLLNIKAEVDEALASQSKIESGLFEIQREVAVTLDEVYKLEARLAEREKELLKITPSAH